MDKYTLDFGIKKTNKNKEMEFKFFEMDQFIKVIGNKIEQMELGD